MFFAKSCNCGSDTATPALCSAIPQTVRQAGRAAAVDVVLAGPPRSRTKRSKYPRSSCWLFPAPWILHVGTDNVVLRIGDFRHLDGQLAG